MAYMVFLLLTKIIYALGLITRIEIVHLSYYTQEYAFIIVPIVGLLDYTLIDIVHVTIKDQFCSELSLINHLSEDEIYRLSKMSILEYKQTIDKMSSICRYEHSSFFGECIFVFFLFVVLLTNGGISGIE